MLTISFCTSIHNRLPQFREQYARNRDAVLGAGGVEWVILDFNSSDGLREFMESQGELPPQIRYLRDKNHTRWHSSVAKNLAHRAGSGDVLMNLDCDNLIDDAIQVIREEFSNGADVLHLCSGVPHDGTYGRIAIRGALFHQLGGYDESFEPMGFQDDDLLDRTRHYGARMLVRRSRPGIAIKNTKEESISHCGSTKTWLEMKAANVLRSRENIENGNLVANRGRNERAGHGMLTISFCTSIHNRLHQFQQQYAANRDVVLGTEGVEWVILDYNSTDGLREFMESQGPLPPQIKYLEKKDHAGWHLSVAKNLSHAAASGQVLMSLDCDNLIDDAVQVIREIFAKGADILHLWSGIPVDGTFGRVAIRRKLFHDLGGYDESFEPMGFQDKDLILRAESYGARMATRACRPGIAVLNTKEEAIANCGSSCKTWQEMRTANASRSRENIKNGNLVANRGRNGNGPLNP